MKDNLTPQQKKKIRDDIFGKNATYSAFRVCRIDQKNKQEVHFFPGNLSLIITSIDDRFKAIKNVRKESKFLGTVNGLIWPVKFPVRLNNGSKINKYGEFLD